MLFSTIAGVRFGQRQHVDNAKILPFSVEKQFKLSREL